MNRYKKYAPILVQNGYDVTPVSGKAAILTRWSNRPKEAKVFNAFPSHNIGVLCGGKHNIVGVDVDVVNPFAANQFLSLIEDTLGFAPRRIGKPPKFLMVFKCEEPFFKIKTGTYEFDENYNCVELLGEGQQFVCSGIHPDTNEKYQWVDDSLLDIEAKDLTVVSSEAFKHFINVASSVLANFGSLKGRVSQRTTPQNKGLLLNELEAPVKKVQTALNYLPNDDEHYDDWVNTIHAIKGAVGEEGYSLAHDWSEKSVKYDKTKTDKLWNSIKKVDHIGAGSLFHWASENGFDVKSYSEFEGPKSKQNSEIICAADIAGPLPEREWLLHDWFPAKAVSALFGQGGVGKTLLAQQLANCVAEGVPFLGIKTRKMPVLAVFCEDDVLEISRRQLSINDWMGVNEIVGKGTSNLHIWPRVGEDNILVTFPSQGEAKAGEFYDKLYEKVEELKTEEIFLIIDTASDVFGGNEVIRREVNTFIKTYLGSFCVGLNATVLMLAHPSLSGMSSGSGLSGSTAWENAVRSRAYFSRDDADNDEVRTLSRKKSNYSVSGQSTDMTLLWDNGVYVLPTEPNQIDKIEKRALKNQIIDAVDKAWREQKPFKKRAGRKIVDGLFVLLGGKKSSIARAVKDLELEGEIVLEREGYKIG